ncbi:helix-turn-helix domain-containing protein [Sphaerisporangium rhizosphaerae]|uniref:Helix-turn-helix domain-containing protein n=1 Tax=Sphaerisporangium rhizosphaerae TaxID=2269375 RepID=A0ABW2P7Q2_9ACTN
MSYGTASPGDLGRRLAYHRRRLGLTRRQVAERAGVVPGYVQYLETYPSPLDEGVLLRLAAALETTALELLGGNADRPPGQGGPAGRPVLRPLGRDECLRLIAPGGVGRVAYAGSTGPAVFPVNYVFHGGAIVFRTRAGGPMDRDLRGGVAGVAVRAGFEVDRIDEAERRGWSVLVQGPAQHLAPDETPPQAAVLDVRPWAGGERDQCIRIIAQEVSGRRIEGI